MNCGRAHLLEPMVAGELPHLQAELRAHAAHCSLCRHELRWLESEQELFRQRAGRDEVAHLWNRFEHERVSSHRVGVFASLAAVLLIGLTIGRLLLSAPSAHSTWNTAADDQSVEVMSMGDAAGLSAEVCSQLPPGLGFHCGPAIPASFLAAR